MSLGIGAYLAWTPVDLEGAAHWFSENSRLLDRVARTVRDGAERGTEAQDGQFIDAVRDDADATARRIDDLADMMLEASETIREVGAALTSAVDRPRAVDAELEAAGFTRDDGAVRDRTTRYADAAERVARERAALEYRDRLWDLVHEIRDADERANHSLHAVVGRGVRDRTPEGNGGLSTILPVAAGDSALAALSPEYERLREAARGARDLPWWKSVRGITLVGPILGFVGGVANSPEDEPLYETLLAEGAGVLGGLAGSIAGLAGGTLAGGG